MQELDHEGKERKQKGNEGFRFGFALGIPGMPFARADRAFDSPLTPTREIPLSLFPRVSVSLEFPRSSMSPW